MRAMPSTNWQWRSMAKRCVDCRWAFSVFAEQEDRVRCKACESRSNARVLGEWKQLATFLSGADEATADLTRTAELPRGQSAGGLTTPAESSQFPIDDMEF